MLKKLLLSAAVAIAAIGSASADVIDVLNQENVGNSGTTYTVYSYTGASGAKYSLQCAGDKSSIQLRSKNSNSGIVTTQSAGKVKSVKVTWNTATDATRVLDIYGSNTAYTAPSDLYGNNKGTKLGSLNMSATPNTFTVEGDYEYIGLRSNSGAMYLTEIEIVWESGDPTKITPKLSFEEASKTVVFSGEAVTFNNKLTNDSNVSPLYYSLPSNCDFATINSETGEVTVTGTGTANVIVKFEGNDEFNPAIASYVFSSVKGYATLAEVNALMPAASNGKSEEILITCDLTVTYVNGQSAYVTDGTSYGLLYGTQTLNANDIIAGGFTAKVTNYNGLAEITDFSNLTVKDEKGNFEPKTYTLDQIGEANVNEVFVVTPVTFATATPSTKTNFNAEGSELVFRNNFTIASVDAGNYSVKGAGCIHNGTVQVYPIEYTAVTEEPKEPVLTFSYEGGYSEEGEIITVTDSTNVKVTSEEGAVVYYSFTEEATEPAEDTFVAYPADGRSFDKDGFLYLYTLTNGVKSIVKEYMVIIDNTVSVAELGVEAADAQYFTLQGVRVENPQQGLFIKVQNGKAAKVLVK